LFDTPKVFKNLKIKIKINVDKALVHTGLFQYMVNPYRKTIGIIKPL